MLAPTGDLPSLVAAVAGGAVAGSWWSHPKAHAIYNLFAELREHNDIAVMKLVADKVTLIHRTLFPVVLRLGLDTDWRNRQSAGLGDQPRTLLAEVEQNGQLALNMLAPSWPGGMKALKGARTALERSGLALGDDRHTETGAHTTILQSWADFARTRGTAPDPRSWEEAMADLRRSTGQERLAFDLTAIKGRKIINVK